MELNTWLKDRYGGWSAVTISEQSSPTSDAVYLLLRMEHAIGNISIYLDHHTGKMMMRFVDGDTGECHEHSLGKYVW